MPRLIWVFTGRTCHFVGFVTMRLKYVSDQLHIYIKQLSQQKSQMKSVLNRTLRCSGVLLVFNLQVQRNSGWRDVLLKSKLQTSWACSLVIVSDKFMSMCISKAIYSNLTTSWTYYWQEYDLPLYEWGPPSEVGGGWEGTVPLVPWNKWPFSHVPLKQNLDFLCSLFPKTGSVPLFPSFLDLWSPENMPSFPCSPKPIGVPH